MVTHARCDPRRFACPQREAVRPIKWSRPPLSIPQSHRGNVALDCPQLQYVPDDDFAVEGMTIFEERGLFWWRHEPVPDRQFAPDASVSGLLKIEEDGIITLDLDGYLPGGGFTSALSVFSDDMNADLKDKRIQGILKVSGKTVLLDDLQRGGRRLSTNGPSFEQYQALHCLVGNVPLPKGGAPFAASGFEVDLQGFEEWLRFGNIVTTRTDTEVTATHAVVDDLAYQQPEGELKIIYNILSPPGGWRDHIVELKETAAFGYHRNTDMSVKEIVDEYGLLRDLFVILTDSEYALSWPKVKTRNGQNFEEATLYFYRKKTSATPPKRHETPTNFLLIKETFGGIFAAWKAKRERFGPGFYLYLGLRRGHRLYLEHRFVNLIWGLEAFHRKCKPPGAAEAKIETKVARILAQVEEGTDKKWLTKRLKNAHEPTLEQRMFDVIKSVPLGLDDENIRGFARRCADLRNDISHFGADRHGRNYHAFLRELQIKSEALSIVYHMLILHEIGLQEATIKYWVYESFRAYIHKRYLSDAGLLVNIATKPESPAAPSPP